MRLVPELNLIIFGGSIDGSKTIVSSLSTLPLASLGRLHQRVGKAKFIAHVKGFTISTKRFPPLIVPCLASESINHTCDWARGVLRRIVVEPLRRRVDVGNDRCGA